MGADPAGPPRLVILSHSEAYYSTRRLQEAAVGLGLSVERVDPVRVTLRAHPEPAVFEDGAPLPPPDILLPRIGAALVKWSASLVDLWRLAGVRCPLSGDAISRASCKLSTALALGAAGLPTVPTVAIREANHASDALLAQLPPSEAWVIKRPHGTGGVNVARAESPSSALSFLSTLVSDRSIGLLQPFVATAPIRDIRVLIAGLEPLGACLRNARAGEFRANIHRGATATTGPLPGGALELAVAAARAVDLPFCGVDLIETPSGLCVLEVNASPGFEGIEAAHGADLATPFLSRYIAW